MKQLVVIRIRGIIGIKKGIKDTLNMLRLYNKHYCVILKNTPQNLGMIKKAKDYVTWGEIKEDVLHLLLKSRGKLPGNNHLTEEYLKNNAKMNLEEFIKELYECKKSLKDIPGLKLFFRLKPPVGGFERKGIKNPFSLGGVLGYRKEKINDLLKKMI